MQIGFIGVGKITNAIVEGLCTSSIENARIFLSPRNEANARHLAEKYTQVQRLKDNQQVIDQSDIVFIAVRPAVAVVIQLFRHLGQPVQVTDEQQLHALWTLTGLITPFYDLLHELSSWSITNGVDAPTANQYIAGLFQALCFAAQQDSLINFKELARHAETPNGMNEQAGKEIREKGAHDAYRIASDNLLKRFE